MPKKAKTTNTRRLAGVCSGAWENRTPDILLAKRGRIVRTSSPITYLHLSSTESG